MAGSFDWPVGKAKHHGQSDVAGEQQILGMFKEVVAALGALDVLVNNFGIQKAVASDEVEAASYDPDRSGRLVAVAECSLRRGKQQASNRN